MKFDEKGRCDLDSLEPGEGIARFFDGHEEPFEHWKHIPNGMTFYTSSGKYIYDIPTKSFYRLVWEIESMSITGRCEYAENHIYASNEIASIWYKEYSETGKVEQK